MFRQQAEMDQRGRGDFDDGGEDGEERDEKSEEDVRLPQGLHGGDGRDFVERKKRQKSGAEQGGKPRDGEEDKEGEVGEF